MYVMQTFIFLYSKKQLLYPITLFIIHPHRTLTLAGVIFIKTQISPSLLSIMCHKNIAKAKGDLLNLLKQVIIQMFKKYLTRRKIKYSILLTLWSAVQMPLFHYCEAFSSWISLFLFLPSYDHVLFSKQQIETVAFKLNRLAREEDFQKH